MAEWSYGIVPGMDTGMTGDKQYDQAWEDAQRKCPKTDPNNSDFNAYGQRVVMDGVYHCAIKRPGTEETPMGIRYTEYWTCFEYDLERYVESGEGAAAAAAATSTTPAVLLLLPLPLRLATAIVLLQPLPLLLLLPTHSLTRLSGTRTTDGRRAT